MSKRRQIMFLVIMFSVILLGTGAIVLYQHNHIFRLDKEMKETAYSVDGDVVKLQDCMYYIMIEEDDVNDKAEVYDKDNPKAYWNLYINNQFMSRVAAKIALNYAIRDDLVEREAKKDGYTLTTEESSDAQRTGIEIYEGMTEKQLKSTHLTEEQLKEICEKRSLVDNYLLDLAQKNGVVMSESELNDKYGVDSDYYTGLKSSYNVVINEDLWDQISLGSITIN